MTDYKRYLKTRHWQAVRKAALKRADYKCQVCGERDMPLSVHHNNYGNRGKEQAADVITLCGNCHEAFHDRLALAEKREVKDLVYA